METSKTFLRVIQMLLPSSAESTKTREPLPISTVHGCSDLPRGPQRAATLALLILSLSGGPLMALEKPEYEVLVREGDRELRAYGPYIVAETYVDSDFESAGNEGFRRLADYIFGNNRSRKRLEMTAPVSQTSSEKIAMTAPVSMEREGRQYRVTFMMPSEFTLDTLPVPVNLEVRLSEVPGQLLAAVRYSGTWSRRRYEQHLAEVEAWVADQGWTIEGEPVFARYDPPIVPWFLRRNEILLPVATTKSPPTNPNRTTP